MSTSSPVGIDMKTSCVFCLAEASRSALKIRTEEYWSYIQPTQWKGNPPVRTPPMCSVCSEKVKEIAKCHQEIVELGQKLFMVRKQLDEAAKAVRERMEKVTVPACRLASLKDLGLLKTNKAIHLIVKNPNNPSSFSRKRSFDQMMQSSSRGTCVGSTLKIANVAGSTTESPCQTSTSKKVSEAEVKSSNLTDSTPTRAVNSIAPISSSQVVNVPGSSKEIGHFDEDEDDRLSSLEEDDDDDDEDPNSDYQFKEEEESDDSKPKSEYEAPSESEYSKDPLDDDEYEQKYEDNKIEVLSSSEDGERDESNNSSSRTFPPPKALPRLEQLGCGICVICGVKLPLSDLYNHTKGHVGDYAFQCPTCSVSFPSRLSFTYHGKDHRRCCAQVKPIFKCDFCTKKIGYRSALRHSQESHELFAKEKNFTCPMPSCRKTFAWKQTLELHLGTHELIARMHRRKNLDPWMESSWADVDLHEDIVLPPNQFLGRANKRLCYICGVKLPVHELHKHVKGHVGDLAFQCQSCLVTFSSRLSLTYFSADHRESCKDIERKFNCDLCGEEISYCGLTTTSKHFQLHETQEKNYTCPMKPCGEAFTQRQSLELHLGKHENQGKRYRDRESKKSIPKKITTPCEICGSSIPVSKSVMHEHIASHVGEFAFQCPMEKCQRAFASRYTAACKRHGKGESGSCKWIPPKICEECKEEFDTLTALRPHLQRHEISSEKNFTCPIPNCGKGFTIKQSVEFHLASHAFRRKLQNCTLCRGKRKRSNLGRTPSDMEAHLKDEHSVKIICKCPHCPFVFRNQEDLVDHISNHGKLRDSTGVKCHLCSSNELFRDGNLLRRHYFQEHQIGKEYLCEHCDFSSLSFHTFRGHRNQFHGNGKKERIYRCEICEKKPEFNSADELRAHDIKVHDGEKYACNFCPLLFNTRKSLLVHEKYTHRGVQQRTWPCSHSQCDMVFDRKDKLINHVELTHSDSKNDQDHPCNKCEKSYQTEIALKAHVKRCHENVRVAVVCEICGKSCRDKKALETHMRIHTGEKPYLCNLCGLSFRQQTSLRNHTKTHERKGDQ